jgi:hypothetical protein
VHGSAEWLGLVDGGQSTEGRTFHLEVQGHTKDGAGTRVKRVDGIPLGVPNAPAGPRPEEEGHQGAKTQGV